MARKNNKTCIVCSAKYSFCPNCAEYDHLPRWMTIYHNENCKNVFNATSDYLAGDISKEEAKEILDKCDLSYKNQMNFKIIEAINNVYDVPVDFEEQVKIDSVEVNESFVLSTDETAEFANEPVEEFGASVVKNNKKSNKK